MNRRQQERTQDIRRRAIHVIIGLIVWLILLLWARSRVHAQTILPPNLHPDTTHAPFLLGVASGDPLTDRVILWTHYQNAPSQTQPATLTYQVATDPAFANIVASGTTQARPTRDWTAQVDATGLQPHTRYWYRFRDSLGNTSTTGRTQTAPASTGPHFRAAIASCSSIYSGYFNAYRRIGQRQDIDLIIHLGDYIYDFVDEDEEVRVPTPAPTDPVTLQDWRDRHRYYLLDPDLRHARNRHPWAAIWDNHDLDGNQPATSVAKQAFFEYLPIRQPDTTTHTRIYRKLSLGPLADLFLLDVTTQRDRDTLPGAIPSIIGDSQWTWLSAALQSSTAQWKLIGNQRMVGRFSLAGLPSFIPFGDGPVADSGAWDGYTADRIRLLQLIDTAQIPNVIILSGDIHMSFACDLAPDGSPYDPQTGAGSVAVEFLPTSITRGNFDEAGFGGFLATLAQTAMTAANPHHVYSELESHGYGILDLRTDRAVGEFWYSDILTPTPTETFATAYQCLDGARHWDRTALGSPSVGLSPAPAASQLRVFPNPATHSATLHIPCQGTQPTTIQLWAAATGQHLKTINPPPCSDPIQQITLPLQGLPAGMYLIHVPGIGSTRLILQK